MKTEGKWIQSPKRHSDSSWLQNWVGYKKACVPIFSWEIINQRDKWLTVHCSRGESERTGWKVEDIIINSNKEPKLFSYMKETTGRSNSHLIWTRVFSSHQRSTESYIGTEEKLFNWRNSNYILFKVFAMYRNKRNFFQFKSVLEI